MDIFDKFFKKFAYKFDKGYPDMNNSQDVLLLESLFEKLGINLNEAPTAETEKGIEILKSEFNFDDEDFKEVTSKTYKVLVPKNQRKEFNDKIASLENFKEKERFKISYKDKVTFILKPKDSSESYNIKPQNVNVSGDYEYSISELLSDVKIGLGSHPNLSPLQKEYLIQYLDNNVNLTPEQTQEIVSDKNFINQVQKNFSEISGVIYYVENILKLPASKIEFPIRGNEPLVDSYIIKPDGSRVRISSKAKSGGNIVKPEGLLQSAEDINYTFADKDKEEILNIINSNPVIQSNLLLAKYGDEKIQQYKSQIEKARVNDPNLKQPENRQLHYNFERELIRQINAKFDFSDIFNDLLDVVYVKTATSPKTGKPTYSIVDPGKYRVVLQSKNIADPQRPLERIGFQMRG
jgi:tellurite resistance protein